MNLRRIFPERVETEGFSRSNYEMLFSVFMVALAYLYRRNPLIAYPEILYLFMSLLAANFVFNRIFSERSRVSLWLVDAMLASNLFIITAIISKSGGHLSYFWVLYLLPIFTAALTGRLLEVAATTSICVLALGTLSAAAARADTAQMFAFCVKSSVFLFSVFVTYRAAISRRRLETEVSSKRFQVEKLIAAASESEFRAQTDASAAEVGRMTASLLHDIGNVISIIMLSAEIMVTEETPNPNDARRVQQAARMAKSIIDGSLALIKGARYEFRAEPLSAPMENAAAIFTRQANSKGVSISVSVEEGLPNVRVSVPHVQRVFINAIVNSLALLKPGGTIVLRAVKEGEMVRISIEDNGPGFPSAMLERGIAAFGTTRGAKGGTGLGLFNSKEIVEKHGGTIAIRNRQPAGAIVEFTLPLAGPGDPTAAPSPIS
jgi:signal transduction histidine kinase